jgi:branched-chain amino acid aminotransferase
MSNSIATSRIWHNGRLIDWDDARIHVLSHVVSYGSSVFEGMRCYSTPEGCALFRASDHMQRLLNSAKIYRMEVPFSRDELVNASAEVIRENNLDSGYIRPIVLRGYGTMGVMPQENPIEVFIAAWKWGRYLGQEAQEKGVDVCVSSWNRLAPNTLPAMAKAGANYMNSQLMKMEATTNGYVEAIALDTQGFVSEGSGENVFLVRDGRLYTPPLSSSVLPGITRDTIIQVAADLGIPTIEQTIPREALYLADELFFSGTAVELTPIRSVDRIAVGNGARGPITAEIQRRFFQVVTGVVEDLHGWLTPVGQAVTAGR